MTLDQNDSIFEEITVEDGIIKALGTTKDILKLNKDDTIIYDLEGNSVLPAFNDSHMHLLEYAFTLSRVSESKFPTKDDLDRISKTHPSS